MDKQKPNIKIIVACHKADPNIREDDVYMPVHVGKALHPDFNLGFQGDDTGDNISEKNPAFCELTGLYWAWKNLPQEVEFVGLAHYRRYLDIHPQDIKKLREGHVIVSVPLVCPIILAENMAIWTSLEDVKILVENILKLFPDTKEAMEKYLYNNNKIYDCNMFVMNREDFDNYCSFLFKILQSCEQQIKTYPFVRQRRVVGYLGEMILGIWCVYRKKKLIKRKKLSPGYNYGLKLKLRDLQNNIAFKISKLGHSKEKINFNPAVIINS